MSKYVSEAVTAISEAKLVKPGDYVTTIKVLNFITRPILTRQAVHRTSLAIHRVCWSSFPSTY